MLNYQKIIERICSATGWKKTKVAEQVFNISLNNLSNRTREGRLDFNALLTWALTEGVDIKWLITGQGTAPGNCHVQEIPNAASTSRAAEQKTQKSNAIEVEHSKLIKQFRDKARAKAISEDLIRLENLNEEAFRNVGSYIKSQVQELQLENNPAIDKQNDSPTAEAMDKFTKRTFMFMVKTIMYRLEGLEVTLKKKLQDFDDRLGLIENKEKSGKVKTGTNSDH
jgi:type II secretory pathway pseudopilin PulG